MSLLTPSWLQPSVGDPAISYTAQQDRASVLGAMFGREGVYDLIGGDLKVTQRAAGANFTVDVAAGRAAIDGDDISDQGTYICTSTTTASVTVPAAPGSGTRTHRVIARVKDHLSNATWATYEWTIELLADTGAGMPALPASAISLASVAVAAGAASVTNAMITDLRSRATVGTPDISGNWSLNTTNWAQSDAGRPLCFRANPDGWVSLAGWVNRAGPTFTCIANTQYNENPTTLLPTAMRPNVNRDFLGLTSLGPVHWLFTPSGACWMRFTVNTTLPNNGVWMSFDGTGYRMSN